MDADTPLGPQIDQPAPRWARRERLRFIDSRLRWVGWVNSNDLVHRFGIVNAQAGKDIAQYRSMARQNVMPAPSKTLLSPSPNFLPLFPGEEAPDPAILPAGIPFATLPISQRRIDASLFRTIVSAIEGRAAIDALYQPINRPEPLALKLSPHALALAGRWHFRAYSTNHRGFRDFLFSRLLSASAVGPAEANPQDDIAWNTSVVLLLEPDPRLSPSQRDSVAFDYGMVEGQVRVSCRVALLLYTLVELNITDQPLDLLAGFPLPPVSPERRAVTLANRDEIIGAWATCAGSGGDNIQ